jgi:hypothetical protein
MLVYPITTQEQIDAINQFNNGGLYFAIICDSEKGKYIVDTLNESAYAELKQYFSNNPVNFDTWLEIPLQVPTWRLRAILAVDGLEANVTSALATLPEPNKTYAERAWNNGSTTERNSPTVTMIKAILTLTDSEVDDIFQRAANIVV